MRSRVSTELGHSTEVAYRTPGLTVVYLREAGNAATAIETGDRRYHLRGTSLRVGSTRTALRARYGWERLTCARAIRRGLGGFLCQLDAATLQARAQTNFFVRHGVVRTISVAVLVD